VTRGPARRRLGGAGGGTKAHPGQGATAAVNVTVAFLLAVGGYVHLDLYRHGYREIHDIGVAFLLQAAGSFAIAALLLLSLVVAGSPVLRLGAAGLSVGALVAFALSRTVGVFGFIERGLQPSPQALISVLAEGAVLLVLAGHAALTRGARDTGGVRHASRAGGPVLPR
jgi:hypothetical protein